MTDPARPSDVHPCAGAVLCGGASRRMGRDKALLELGGVALAARVARAMTAAGADPVVAVGGDADALGRWQLAVVADDHPGEGPLGGVLTALHALREHPIVAILACDLAEPHPATIRAVVHALRVDTDADVAVPVHLGRRHFHHAVWRQRALPTIEQAFRSGERAPRRVSDELRVVEVVVARPETLRDVDDPAAFAAERRR